MIIDILIYIFAIFYFIEFSILFYGLTKATKIKKNNFYEPSVSVIIAARNEENNIRECIESLKNLNYPSEKLELIIVNDNSVDNTQNIVEEYQKSIKNLHLLNATPSTGKLRGKANAIKQGIDLSKGEILLFTDADCRVNKNWVRETVKYFNYNVGIVGGFTLLKSNKIFGAIQTLDWIFLYNIAAATATLGFPLTGIGNNLSVKKSYYMRTGGFENIPFSVTEDYMLTRAILDKTDANMVFLINPDTLIESSPCNSIKELFHQKKRWGVGGLDMIPIGFLIFSIPFIFYLLLILGMILLRFKTLIIALILKFFIDFLFLSFTLKILTQKNYLRYFLLFELYLFIYVISLPIVVIFSKKIIWKERKF